ncbi:MAG: hypothetical protein ACLURY_10805 [Alistipes putredinis]
MRTSSGIFPATAAPVARIIASVTAGEARLNRDRAPSTIVVPTPRDLSRSIRAFRPAVSEGPESSNLPLIFARAVISRPSAVRSRLTSRTSAASRFSR